MGLLAMMISWLMQRHWLLRVGVLMKITGVRLMSTKINHRRKNPVARVFNSIHKPKTERDRTKYRRENLSVRSMYVVS